jgi:Heavy metal binding domain
MKYLRLLSVPLLAAALLLTTGSGYTAAFVTDEKNSSANSQQKPAHIQYVCPMHEDVKSKRPGKCYKCKMKLEKKRIKEPTDS